MLKGIIEKKGGALMSQIPTLINQAEPKVIQHLTSLSQKYKQELNEVDKAGYLLLNVDSKLVAFEVALSDSGEILKPSEKPTKIVLTDFIHIFLNQIQNEINAQAK